MNKKYNIISGIVNAVVGVIVALVCFFSILLPALNDNAQYKQAACVYSDSAYDYVAPAPLQEQVEQIKAQPSVKSVYEYYLYEATVSVGGERTTADAMFSESDNLDITPFNKSRLVDGGSANNAVYFSKSVADDLDAQVGDAATVSFLGKTVRLKVGKIFLDDDGIRGKVIFKLTDALKSEILSDDTALAGVYIEANDVAAVRTYLDSYIPMGRMLTRDYFDSDLQYESYREEFLSKNYASVISDKAVLQDVALRVNREYLEDADSMLLLGAILFGVIMFVVVILNLVAALVYDKRSAMGGGFLISGSAKEILLFTLFALLAVACCAGTLGILYGVNVSGLLFVNSFNAKVIGYSMLAIFIGGALGVMIDVGFCALYGRR